MSQTQKAEIDKEKLNKLLAAATREGEAKLATNNREWEAKWAEREAAWKRELAQIGTIFEEKIAESTNNFQNQIETLQTTINNLTHVMQNAHLQQFCATPLAVVPTHSDKYSPPVRNYIKETRASTGAKETDKKKVITETTETAMKISTPKNHRSKR